MLQEALPRPVPEGAGVGRAGLRAGVRAGFPFAIAGGILAVSFGVVAQDVGMSQAAAIIMSTIVFAGSAQFAALAIVGGGGAIGAAIVAAALMNSRFLAMSIALAPSLPGGPLWRALQGQATVDASWAIAARGDGTFDRALLFGSTAIQYVFWVGGTIVGALGGGIIGDTDRFGLDAVYPAFFAALLLNELHHPRARAVAAAGGAIALVLVPIAPAGVPILAASLAALAGLTRQARRETAELVRAEGGSVSGTATLIAGCAVVTFLIKAAGPVALGGRELPIAFRSVVMVLAPALFAALVVTQALADGKHLHVGPETFGVAAGTFVAWRTGSIVWCVIAAAAVTGVLRAV